MLIAEFLNCRFLRWRAIQDAAFIDPADGKEKIWSESNVSEDFDMALRLLLKGYIVRYALHNVLASTLFSKNFISCSSDADGPLTPREDSKKVSHSVWTMSLTDGRNIPMDATSEYSVLSMR